MKKVIFDESTDIHLVDVSESTPIFVKKSGSLCGMVVNESPSGWIIRIGGSFGAAGHHKTRLDCINESKGCGYTFHAEE